MRHLVILFTSLFFAHLGLCQKANSTIKGFESEQILAKPPAGSNDTNQIIWRAVMEEGWIYVLDSSADFKKSRVLQVGDLVVFRNRQDSLVGYTWAKPGEGLWNVAHRILVHGPDIQRSFPKIEIIDGDKLSEQIKANTHHIDSLLDNLSLDLHKFRKDFNQLSLLFLFLLLLGSFVLSRIRRR